MFRGSAAQCVLDGCAGCVVGTAAARVLAASFNGCDVDGVVVRFELTAVFTPSVVVDVSRCAVKLAAGVAACDFAARHNVEFCGIFGPLTVTVGGTASAVFYVVVDAVRVDESVIDYAVRSEERRVGEECRL